MYLLTTNCPLILFFKLLLPKFQEVASQAQFLFSCHHILEKSANQFPEKRWHMLAKNSWYDSIISGCRSFWWRSDRTQVPFILKPNKNVWMETNLSLVCLSTTSLSLLNISSWQIQRWFVPGESSFKVSLTEFADTLFLLDPRFDQLSLKLKCLFFNVPMNAQVWKHFVSETDDKKWTKVMRNCSSYMCFCIVENFG